MIGMRARPGTAEVEMAGASEAVGDTMNGAAGGKRPKGHKGVYMEEDCTGLAFAEDSSDKERNSVELHQAKSRRSIKDSADILQSNSQAVQAENVHVQVDEDFLSSGQHRDNGNGCHKNENRHHRDDDDDDGEAGPKMDRMNL